MKLEQIAPYLPYKLQIQLLESMIEPLTLIGISHTRAMGNHVILDNKKYRLEVTYDQIKPILRPLSDLTKLITHNGETFVPIEKLKDYYNSLPDSFVEKLLWVAWDGQFTVFGLEEDPLEVAMPYSMYQKVFEWHFDVFGLIDSGEAIDINTLK